MDWWDRDKIQDKLPFLNARGSAKAAIEKWFAGQKFTEVETSQLQISPGNETHLRGFETQWQSPSQRNHQLYLATSPEFSHKKLIAGGMERIYEFARVFRNGEIGPLHSPEFTMLEWYRAGEDWNKIIEDTLEICVAAGRAVGVDYFSWKGKSVSINTAPISITLAQAFRKYANIDLLSTLDSGGNGQRAKLADAAIRANINFAVDDNWSDIFTKILVAKIEPNLGFDAPTILCEYPLPEAALARKCSHDPRVVERFELYICGVEIANGFGELTDAIEQRARFEAAMHEMKRIYGYNYPLDEELLSALAQMPGTSGVALGFDRLVMLISGARSINDVLWTPFPVEQI
ncbi:MAG: lysyl-tRNA synthetase class II [Hyphomonadaceae bacterium]|nr:MAG: lysyl-tRNA synthetase class II [Hyphomonadaceae bacterium]KAF0186913.1 MAG: lysyl-tRNA synthetase class II [Hyphomonadaceae bacterium]